MRRGKERKVVGLKRDGKWREGNGELESRTHGGSVKLVPDSLNSVFDAFHW